MLRPLPAVLVGILLAAASARGEIVLTGSVAGPDGKPLADARVELLPVASGFDNGRLLLAGRLEPEPAAVAGTDGEGRYRLAAPGRGVWKVVAAAPGLVPAELASFTAVESRELAPAALAADLGTRVRVAGRDGEARAGVWVWADPADPRQRRRGLWNPHFRAGRTDREGWTRLPRAPAERLRVRALDRGAILAEAVSSEAVVTVRVGDDVAPRRLELAPGPPVDVPILVRAGPLAWPVGFLEHGRPLSFPGPREAPMVLWLVGADGRRKAIEMPATAGSRDPWRVAPPASDGFGGRVLDGATRRGVAGAVVWLGADPGVFALTDEEGRYRLAAPTRDRFWIQAEAAGYRARAVHVSPEEAGAGRASTLALTRAVELRGRVLDTADAPLPSATVAIIPRRRSATDSSAFQLDPADARAWSGAGGAFRLGGLEPGREYDLQVSRPGYAAARLEVTAPGPAAPGPAAPGPAAPVAAPPGPAAPAPAAPVIVVRLARGRAAFGRVVDDRERPVEGVEVVLTAAGARRTRTGDEASEHRGSSGAEGRFTIPRIPAAEVEIAAFKEGFAPLVVRGVEIPAPLATAKNDAFDLGTLVLAQGSPLAGRVVDPEGVGLDDVPIFLVPTRILPGSLPDPLGELFSSRPPDARTDGEGRFRFTRFTPGDRMHLFAGGLDHVGVWVEHLEVPLSEPLRIVLEPGLRLAGKVVDAAGSPVLDAELSLTWTVYLEGLDVPAARPGRKTRRSDVEGRFAFGGLEPGPATLIAWAPGFRESGPREIELPPEEGSPEAGELVIVLERGATVRGRVTDSEDRPLDGVRVSAGRPGSLSDGEGRYRLDGVEPGRVKVHAYHPHHGTLRRELEVEMGDNPLDLVFPAGREVRGRVVDESGGPLEGVALELDSETRHGATFYRGHSTEDGRFRFAPVAAGEYRLDARLPGWTLRGPRTVHVAAEDLEDLRIVLERGAIVSGTVLGLDFDELGRLRVGAGTGQDALHHGRVDYRGVYEIRDLPPGDWVVRAVLDGGRRQVQERLEIPPGGVEIRRDLTFSERFVLSGTVLLEGEPLSAARVSLSGRDVAVSREVSSDHLGRFRIDDLEPAIYDLGVAHSRELLVYNRDLRLDGHRDVVIDLLPARLGGRVVDAETGLAVEGALVTMVRLSETGGETNALSAASDAGGSFDFPRAPPGRYRLRVTREGYAAAVRELRLEPGVARRDLELEVRPTPGAEIYLRLAGGGVPRSVTLALLDAEVATVLRESRAVAADGRVGLPTVPEGTFQLALRSPGTVLLRTVLEVPGEPPTLVLEPAGVLEVRVPQLVSSDSVATLELVEAETGRPWVGFDRYGQLISAWPLVGGKATVEGVAPGLWSLRVTASDGQAWDGVAAATPGSSTLVELR